MIYLKKKKNKKQFIGIGSHYINKYQRHHVVLKREKRPTKPDTPKTVKQLLGKLFADKTYLEKLLEDDSKIKYYDLKF